jgi:superfamily I DNA/RNA helicase
VFDQGKGVCLSTVHKAKGLEAQRALLLQHELYGVFAGRAKQRWQREQERNALYVALTRAKQELVYM